MDKEDIIKLAREAGLAHFYDSEGHCSGITDARLVTEGKEQNDDRLVEMLAPFAALVAAAEREACAKVCDGQLYGKLAWKEGAIACAAAIRARGETRLFDDWGGGFPYKQKAWNGLTESQVMDFCKEARQIGVHSLLWKVNNLLKQQNT